MSKPNRLDKKSLLAQLENYKLIYQVNSDLLEEDRLLKEQILHKLGTIEDRVNEMDTCERTHDRTKYNSSLEEANKILDALKELIGQMLGDSDIHSDDNLHSLN